MEYTNGAISKDLEWRWRDLAKYLMTGSIARPLCDSWATCLEAWQRHHSQPSTLTSTMN